MVMVMVILAIMREMVKVVGPSLCPRVESITLSEYDGPVEDLVRFLSSVGMTFAALEELTLTFSPIGVRRGLPWELLLLLLEACPHLTSFKLGLVDLYASSIATGNNHIQGTTTISTVATTIEAENEEEGSGQRLQSIRFLEKQHTSITDLTLRLLTTNDKTIAHLLGKTPHLTRFEINQLALSTGDFLASLPVLCPDIKILKLTNCPMIPSSAYRCLFQHRCGLQLEQLLVYAITLDDPTLRLIASTQGDTLQESTIWGCSKVTDVGFKALLAGCHRLTYLAPNYNFAVSLSIIADDNENDDDGDVDDRDDMTADTERRQNQWSCYNTLKQLRITSLGMQYPLAKNIPLRPPQIMQNREVLRRIRRRIRLLPALEHLWISVPGVDDELIKGFLGVEHQERQEAEGMRSSADHSGNELANEICEETTTTMKTTATNSISAISTNAATVTAAAARTTRRPLVGPRLRILNVFGLKQNGYLGEDIDRFLKNFPALKVFEMTKVTVKDSTDMVERFRKAGVQVRTPDE
ncbi:MAG: hypothetical protein J3R72DRAFT_506015 [Linnemannia gamsii]|nr:MAG: hypothetical protein J3R72DRAFT_506015 [Linnemannia gamsii]